mmetsp:Transcript_52407/g.124813  ORF Transcript_52407/g.124813 Transcript_52407/m.124813 type:complete len:125 (-) Transcript_52407:72-446(-)
MSGMFYTGMMCSDSECNRIIFFAEAFGFIGLPLMIGIWCCCQYPKWKKVEDAREEKRQRQIDKTRVKYDPVDRHTQSYGAIQPMDLESGPEARGQQRPTVVDSMLHLHRSGDVTGANIRNVPDF